MNFAELTQIALLGTERHGVPNPTPTSSLGQLQSQVDVTQREHALLSLAALTSWHERIGRLPARDLNPPPDPCPDEHQAAAGTIANSLLLRLLGAELPELLPEWLMLAAKTGRLARPEALPSLLDNGNSNPELRDNILAVVGERAHWLAGQNQEWDWVRGAAISDDNVWHTGDRAARLIFLQRLRRADPVRARELLRKT